MALPLKNIAAAALLLAMTAPAIAIDTTHTIVGEWSGQLTKLSLKWVFTDSGAVVVSNTVVNIQGTYRITDNGHLMLTFQNATGLSKEAIHAGQEQDSGFVEFINSNEFLVGEVDFTRQ